MSISFKDIESALLDERKFMAVPREEEGIPENPGLYAIRIKDFDRLTEKFRERFRPECFEELNGREDKTLLYIGKATGTKRRGSRNRGLRVRLWEEELHAMGHATFFRSMGAALGYMPIWGSLNEEGHNYEFSAADNAEIIRLIEENLLINYVKFGDADSAERIAEVEKALIEKRTPLFNLQNVPKESRFRPLEDWRAECTDYARGKM